MQKFELLVSNCSANIEHPIELQNWIGMHSLRYAFFRENNTVDSESYLDQSQRTISESYINSPKNYSAKILRSKEFEF